MAIEKDVRKVLDQYQSFGVPPVNTLSPQEARQSPTMVDAVNAVRQQRGDDLTPEAVGDVRDQMIQGPGGELPVRIYSPKGEGPFPVLVYFHSGGWVLGDLESSDIVCRALTNLDQCLVVSVAYRLAPEHKFPAAAQDAYAATQWVMANAEAINGDPRRVAVGGESTGGNLATVVALMARDSGTQLPIYQALAYPVLNHAFDTPTYEQFADNVPLSRERMRWFWGHYLPDEAAGANPYASPLRADDLRGLPPALIITAENDPLLDECEAYAERLLDAGVPVVMSRYQGMPHLFLTMMPVVERARDAVLGIAAGLRSAFSRAPELATSAQPPQDAEMVVTEEVQKGLQMAATGQILQMSPTASTAQVASDQLVRNARLEEDARRMQSASVIPPDRTPPEQESAPIIPPDEIAPEQEAEPVIPDHTPTREAEPVIPDHTPEREAEPVIPPNSDLARTEGESAIPPDAHLRPAAQVPGDFPSVGNPSVPGAIPLVPGTPAEQGTPLRPMEPEAPRGSAESETPVRVGMEVIGVDGSHVGKVKRVRTNDFVIDRRLRRDLTVPFHLIHAVGDTVILSVSVHHIQEGDMSQPSA